MKSVDYSLEQAVQSKLPMLPRLVALILMALGSAWAVETNSQEFRWRGSVEPCGLVAVRNGMGSVRTEVISSRSREVEVVARKRSALGDLEAVTIEVVQKGGGLEIIAMATEDAALIEVDLTVRIPAGIRLKVERP